MTTSSSSLRARPLVLTERDRRLIVLLCRFRLLQRDQIMELAPFRSLTRANTRLAALVRARVLSRKQVPIIPGNGSAQALYFLGPHCGEFIETDAGELTCQARQIARWEWRTVEHVLACNEALIAFGTALRVEPGTALIAFRTEPELRVIFADKSFCPDGWIAWSRNGEAFNAFFEVDLHHEGLSQWRSKAVAYLNFVDSQAYEELFGYPGLHVLVIAKTHRRLESLRKISACAEGLFLFTEMAAAFERPLDSIWLRTEGEETVRPEDA